MPVIAAQAGFVSLPAATYPAAGRTRASMNAQAVSAIAANRSAVNTQNSNHAMWASLPATDPEIRGIGTIARDAPRRRGQLSETRQGPGALHAAPGPWSLDVRRRRQFFLAGTAVGSAGLAVRARVTRADVPLAGDLRAAAVVFLAAVASFVAGFGSSTLAGFGSSTTSSAVALVASAAASTFSSALAATLVALAAVFCATEVTSLEASTTASAVSSSTSSTVSSIASTACSARRTTRRKPG